MKRLGVALLICFCVLGVCRGVKGGYVISKNYTGSHFFDDWDFFTADDPSNGYVNYVSKSAAQQKGLIKATPNAVYIGGDHSNVATGRGRDSVRITTTQSFSNNKNYLFVAHMGHMPSGCGTWPAWWLFGPKWPTNGEVDIIEGINTQDSDQTTLHTDKGCSMENENTDLFTGKWGEGSNGKASTNCYIHSPGQYSNQGCGIISNLDSSYGSTFNNNGGGYTVMEWTDNFIRMFFFTNTNVPADLRSGNPNPDSWGKPYAYFTISPSTCPKSHFQDMKMVLNIDFCGWAGAEFSSMCPGKGSCQDFVRNNPSEFKDAYWLIYAVSVYTA